MRTLGVKVFEMLWVILSGQHDQKTLQTKVFPKGLYILLIFIVFWLFNPSPVFDIHVYNYFFFNSILAGQRNLSHTLMILILRKV